MGQKKTKELLIRIYSSDPIFAFENLTDISKFGGIIKKKVKFGFFLAVQRFVQYSKKNALHIAVCDYNTESFHLTLSQIDKAIAGYKNPIKILFFIQSDYPGIIQREYNIQYHIYALWIFLEKIREMDLSDIYNIIRNFYIHNLDVENILLFLRNDNISIHTYKKIDMGFSTSLEIAYNKIY